MVKSISLDEKIINEYYGQAFQKTVLYDRMRGRQLLALLPGSGKYVIVTRSRYLRKLASICKKEVYTFHYVASEAGRMLALRDGLYYLNKKHIPVFFYHRVARKPGFAYSKTAAARMEKKNSFPKMYEDILAYEPDLKELFGDKYSEEYVSDIGKIPQVVKVGNRYCHEDSKGKCVNVVDGMRVVPDQPESFKRTLHVYGRCGAFGYAVEDGDSFPAQLQRVLTDKGYGDIRVVNHGLWGGEDNMMDHNFLYELQDFKEGDIVLFYRHRFSMDIMRWLETYGMCYGEVTEPWHARSEAAWCFYDKPGHMGGAGYKNLAEIIADDLAEKDFREPQIDLPETGVQYLHNYIEKNEDIDFEKKIREYIESVKQKKPEAAGSSNGAIVMNCNPFTRGHRYLIEYAAERADWLYVFVVEENKSYFEFEDRYRMVVQGTADLENVIVAPSGKFMISSYTFPEYFMKDYVRERNFDVSNDIYIFCREIAPALSIGKRFVGEEPFDPVTANYNETMKKIFPENGMQLVEIPRKTLDDSRIINATAVRKLIEEGGDKEELLKYVPETTYEIIRDKYLGDS